MNKNNIWIHLGLAITLIGMAAIIGQVRTWQNEYAERKKERIERKIKNPYVHKRTLTESEPEVLVKFRSGVDLSEIKKVAAKYNDRVEDEIESVENLVAIDDLDNFDAEQVAKMYGSMTDLVEYAEPNYEISLDQDDAPDRIYKGPFFEKGENQLACWASAKGIFIAKQALLRDTSHATSDQHLSRTCKGISCRSD